MMGAWDAEAKLRWRRQSGSPGVVGQGGPSYTADDDRAILAHAIPDRDLAAQLGRSITAIQIRRHHLKRGTRR